MRRRVQSSASTGPDSPRHRRCCGRSSDRRSIHIAETGLATKPVDYIDRPSGIAAGGAAAGVADTGTPLEETTLEEAPLERAPLKLSATSLACWLHCPFQYWLRYRLKIGREEETMKPETPQMLGGLYHTLLQRLYNDIAAASPDRRFVADNTTRWQARADAIAAELVEQQCPVAPLRPPLLSRMRSVVKRVLEFDKQQFNGWEIVACEQELQRDYPARQHR